MRWALILLATCAGATEIVERPGKSPLITIRAVFRTGAASDPAGQEGVANLTASMLAQGGSRQTQYKQILDAMFPMATEVEYQVDKEMTAFLGETHADNLETFYGLFRQMLLDPGWHAGDLARLKDQSVNFLRTSLRGNNDEELGKEVLYNGIYMGHPYGHHNQGRVAAIEKLTAGDLKRFYQRHYTQANLTIAIAGGYPKGFADRLRKDFAVLPQGSATLLKLAAPKMRAGRHLTLVEKDTRSVAISFGFPIRVKRGDADYLPLMLAASWLGQHRNSGVRLYDRIREVRGLNYGDYAYIEYFPRGMFLMEPEPNLARRQQIFQVWIRPVVPETAHFTLRLAFFELERLHRQGLSQEEFEQTRNFLSKYVNLLIKTKRAESGYAIDSRFYGIGEFNAYVKSGLAAMTRDDVNRAVSKHLSMENVQVVMIAHDAARLRKAIVEEAVSPMKYNAPKPQDVLEEDKTVERYPLRIRSSAIVKAATLFE